MEGREHPPVDEITQKQTPEVKERSREEEKRLIKIVADLVENVGDKVYELARKLEDGTLKSVDIGELSRELRFLVLAEASKASGLSEDAVRSELVWGIFDDYEDVEDEKL